MSIIKDKLDTFAALSLKKKIAALAVFAFFAVVPLVDANFLHGELLGILWIFDLFMIGLVLSAILVLAAFAIMGALVEIAAGLSLLIFLAQSYCAVPVRNAANDNALKAIVGLGLAYIVFFFFRNLYKTLTENLKKIEDKKWPWEKVVFVGLFFLFIVLLTWDVYLVVQPIVSNLCIYK